MTIKQKQVKQFLIKMTIEPNKSNLVAYQTSYRFVYIPFQTVWRFKCPIQFIAVIHFIPKTRTKLCANSEIIQQKQ